MTEEKLKELLDELFSKKIDKKSYNSSGTWQTDAIDKEGRVVVEQIIRQYLLDNRDSSIATLQAKVFAYEQIISNSNFKPILKKESE